MVGQTESRTLADDERFAIITEIGCIASAIKGWPGTPCEVHHLLEGGVRRGHRYTVGLNAWYHRGVCSGSVAATTKASGPSLAHDPRAFHEHFGTDDQLLTIQDALIREVQRERRHGGYLTDHAIGKLARLLHKEVVRGQSPDPCQIEAIHGYRS